MAIKRFLPLSFSLLVAVAAAAANPSGALKPSASQAGCQASLIARPTTHHDTLATSAIGSISTDSIGYLRNAAAQKMMRPAIDKAGNPDFLALLEPPAPPTMDTTPSSCYPPLSFATTSIPSGTAGKPYSVVLSANGGQPPYAWSFGRSNLPAGFAIGPNGDLTGTPSASGSYKFNVIVSDSLKNNVTGALTLKVGSAGSTPPPPPPPPPPGNATGTALTACKDITASGTYYLANDVSSPGVCFGIDANNITLNLNGHTVTYDTGGQPNTPAIEAHDCWSTVPPIDGYCGTQHGGAVIYGGNIVQAQNAGSTFSPVFEFGQSNDISPAPYIHNVTATFQNVGAQFYNSDYVAPGAKIENNVIYDNVTNINHPGQGDLSARAAFQGQAIFIGQNRNNPGVGDTVTGNKFAGSPQGGLYSDNQHTVFDNNDISMNASYTNDFCFAMSADYQVAENNDCHPKSGRGFHVNANYNLVENNTITVTELKQNGEYGGCELDGTYGVQVEFDNSFLPTPPVGDKITGNTITAVAGDCDAAGIRITSLIPGADVTISGNTVTTTNDGGAGHDFGISVDDATGGATITGNTFTDEYTYAYGDWDGYSVTVGSNTWKGTPQFTFVAGDGACDPTQGESGGTCPVSFTFTDSLPNTVSCGPESTATVTVGSHITQCKPNQ